MLKRMMSALACAAALATVGCGPSSSSLCDLACECEGCSNSQYDECVDDLDDGARDAEREECEAEYDDYLACLDDTGECRGDDFETHCGDEKDDLKNCLD